MATAPNFRIEVDIHNPLMDSSKQPVRLATVKGVTLLEPVFPHYPEKLADPGPETASENAIGAYLTATGPAQPQK